jgi:folate-dependent phosphoribosylglycinamide formyltransferase PurN
MKVRDIHRWIGRVYAARPWRPGRARFLLRNAFGYPERKPNDERDHLVAAATWLQAAQDSQPDGGISGRYRLNSGWSSSYPETTGYAIPTLLALAEALGESRFHERARKAVEFLLSVQLPSGGFPGMEITAESSEPSAFNTAQIIHGLLAWHAATGDPQVLEAALRAGEWLVSIQEPDGSWIRHYYGGVACDYAAHLSCWIAELGVYTDEPRFLDSAARHLDWVLSHIECETGWFQRAGFSAEQHAAGEAFTHTIAYTIWGVLFLSEILGRDDGIAAALRAARAVARRLELSRRLPGILDTRWRGRNTAACLTGNCQMALIWLRLYDRSGDVTLLNAALKAIDLVKDAQDIDNPDPGVRGGIAGSDPVWGEYITNAMPNWAAKYFIDALLAKKAVLSRFGERGSQRFTIPPQLPQILPPVVERDTVRLQRIILITGAGSQRVQRLLTEWQSWGFEPTAVVVEHGPAVRWRERILTILRDQGVPGITRSVAGRIWKRWKHLPPNTHHPEQKAVLSFCARRGIRTIQVEKLDSLAGLKALAATKPDLLVHAGAGIIRPSVLTLARLGMVNAHMGILPFYRGMNAAEWAAFNRDPIGCTVLLIDQGIDTGDIIIVRPVDASGATDIASLRASVDAAQTKLLGEVVRYVVSTGELPPHQPQRVEDGCQFFVMHDDLRRRLDAELTTRDAGPVAEQSTQDSG